MIKRLLILCTLFGLPFMILMSIRTSSAALLTLSSTSQNVIATTEAYSAEDVKPSECNSITLDNNIVTGSGTITDTAGKNSLLITTSGADTITGSDGDDCIVANDGNDSLNGDTGTDVCLGGNGDDGFSNCETCYGGGGTDTDLTATCSISNSIELP